MTFFYRFQWLPCWFFWSVVFVILSLKVSLWIYVHSNTFSGNSSFLIDSLCCNGANKHTLYPQLISHFENVVFSLPFLIFPTTLCDLSPAAFSVSFFSLVVFSWNHCFPTCWRDFPSNVFFYFSSCSVFYCSDANCPLCPPESHRCAECRPPPVHWGRSACYSGGCGSDYAPAAEGA